MYEGSLNLWADSPVGLSAPAKAEVEGIQWGFVPIILAGSEIGLVARRPEQDTRFLEVFARYKLADRLGVTEGDRLAVRLLSGDCINFAA